MRDADSEILEETQEQEASKTANTPPGCYSISALEEAYQSSIQGPLDGKPLMIQGVFAEGKRKSYGQYSFDNLRDPKTGRVLSLKIHESLRGELRNGMEYILKGVLDRRSVARGEIGFSLIFLPFEIVNVQAPKVDERVVQEAKVTRMRLAKGRADVDKILSTLLYEGKMPRIMLIFGEGGIVDHDVMRGLREARQFYQIEEMRASMTDRRALIEALRTAERRNFSFVILCRGGGTGLETMDDVELAAAVVSLQIPVGVACGHEVDRSLVRAICDYGYSLPYQAGEHLRELALRARKDIEEREAKPVEQLPVAPEKQADTFYQKLWIFALGAAVATGIMVLLNWLT